MRLLYYPDGGGLACTKNMVSDDEIPSYGILFTTWDEGSRSSPRQSVNEQRKEQDEIRQGAKRASWRQEVRDVDSSRRHWNCCTGAWRQFGDMLYCGRTYVVGPRTQHGARGGRIILSSGYLQGSDAASVWRETGQGLVSVAARDSRAPLD
ncbi:Vegetative incompatibility protein [Alternaria alternata]|nr:Vegetative incompatibility protein [Alternaria alternata]